MFISKVDIIQEFKKGKLNYIFVKIFLNHLKDYSLFNVLLVLFRFYLVVLTYLANKKFGISDKSSFLDAHIFPYLVFVI
jgi:hypothetical protein